MKVAITKKTFSLPTFIANRLDEISGYSGYSQSNLVLQALIGYMHSYEVEGSLEYWLESLGRSSGIFGDTNRSDSTIE